MHAPWTLSTIEAAIFFGMVLALAGVGMGLRHRLAQQ